MAKESREVPWHAMPQDQVLQRLKTSVQGLDTAQAQDRLDETGPNTLEAGEGVNPLWLLLRQVHNPLIYLLIGATAVSLAMGKRVDAAVIAGVVVLNTLLGFIQEWRAEGALAALRKMSAPRARVLRDGQPQQLEASEVAPGDVLALETGDRVAADARVLSSDSCTPRGRPSVCWISARTFCGMAGAWNWSRRSDGRFCKSMRTWPPRRCVCWQGRIVRCRRNRTGWSPRTCCASVPGVPARPSSTGPSCAGWPC
ncbi:MAG: hypothetical protein FJ280_26445 [Planctomycetes bacterium]|nr:hypothetical protein [Planctomycetota bacterium]